MRNIITLLLITLVISACAPAQVETEPAATPTVPSQAGGGDLTDTHWELVSFGEGDTTTPVIAGSKVTLDFSQDGQAGGSGGCNSYGGKYEAQDGNLSISEVVSTLMACVDEQITEQEGRYLKALQAAETYEISGESLTIWYTDGTLNFIAQ